MTEELLENNVTDIATEHKDIIRYGVCVKHNDGTVNVLSEHVGNVSVSDFLQLSRNYHKKNDVKEIGCYRFLNNKLDINALVMRYSTKADVVIKLKSN